MTMLIVLLVIVSTLIYFYLKCSLMQSLVMLFSSVLGVIVAFNYYEIMADQLISRELIMPTAQFLSFLFLYILTVAVFQAGADFLLAANMKLGDVFTYSCKVICGLITGFIFSGVLLTGLGLLPAHGKLFYSRYPAEKALSINNPNKPAINADGFVSNLFSSISAGSLRSGKSFAAIHPDYLTQIHLNKHKKKDDVLSVSSKDALKLPKGKTKKPVRIWDIPDAGPLTVVRVGISSRPVKDGGAASSPSVIRFFPGQLRLVVKDASAPAPATSGKAEAIYPTGFIRDGALVRLELGDVVAPESKEFKDRVLWLDVAFDVPTGKVPTLLQFKQNAMVDLTPYEPVKSTPDIENGLDSDERKENESA